MNTDHHLFFLLTDINLKKLSTSDDNNNILEVKIEIKNKLITNLKVENVFIEKKIVQDTEVQNL